MTEEERRTLMSADIPTIQKLHSALAAIQPSTEMTLFQQRRLLYLCLRLKSEIDISIGWWLIEDVESPISDSQVWRDVDTELGIPESEDYSYSVAYQSAGAEQDGNSPPRSSSRSLSRGRRRTR